MGEKKFWLLGGDLKEVLGCESEASRSGAGAELDAGGLHWVVVEKGNRFSLVTSGRLFGSVEVPTKLLAPLNWLGSTGCTGRAGSGWKFALKLTGLEVDEEAGLESGKNGWSACGWLNNCCGLFPAKFCCCWATFWAKFMFKLAGGFQLTLLPPIPLKAFSLPLRTEMSGGPAGVVGGAGRRGSATGLRDEGVAGEVRVLPGWLAGLPLRAAND